MSGVSWQGCMGVNRFGAREAVWVHETASRKANTIHGMENGVQGPPLRFRYLQLRLTACQGYLNPNQSFSILVYLTGSNSQSRCREPSGICTWHLIRSYQVFQQRGPAWYVEHPTICGRPDATMSKCGGIP